MQPSKCANVLKQLSFLC